MTAYKKGSRYESTGNKFQVASGVLRQKIKNYLGITCPVSLMAAKDKRLITRSEIPNPQATGQSEPPLRDEFVAETLQAISELDRGLAKTYSGKKKFLDDLEHL